MPLRAKTLAVLAVPLAPLLISAALVMATARRENVAQDLVTHTLEVKAQIATIGGLLADAEVGVRGFLLTRHPDSLEAYDNATELLVPVARRLVELVRDDPDQMQHLRRLGALIAARPLTALLDYAHDPQSPPSPPPDLLTRSRETMIALRVELAAMQDIGDRLLGQRLVLARRAEDQLVAAVIGGAVLGLLGGLVAAAAFSAGITRRIDVVRANAGRLAHGRPLDAAPDADDELGVLSRQLIDVGSLLADRVCELETARDELDRFFSVSLDMLCISKAGVLTRLNPAWQETLGWSVDELTAGPYLNFVHPDDIEATAEVAGRLADGEVAVNFENRCRCKDGTYRWLNWNAAPVQSRGVIYAAARDVTEERRIREQLERRMAELAELNQELEAFTYSVSHDLRAPLRHITGFASLLERSAAQKLDGEERRRLNAVTGAAGRMGRLIDDLLGFSRMSRAAVARQRVRLEDIVNEARREVAADPAAQHVAWKVAPLPEVEGDPAMLRQAFVNLLQNAVKYTRRQPNATVEIGTNGHEAGETVVFVRDNGVGFDMRYVHKLFGVFQRLHSADEFEGTGIGLASVRRIIDRHGGRTWAEGEVDRGATFYVALPASMQAGAPVPEASGATT